MPVLHRDRHSELSPLTYGQIDEFQKKIAQSTQPYLLLSEVAPVVTLGRRAKRESEVLDDALLKSMNIPVVQTSRGGLATYHGPGQWVLFVVAPLKLLVGPKKGVREMTCKLLNVASRTCRQVGMGTTLGGGERLGLWTKKGKIASVGISIESGWVQHGLSLNVNRTQKSFLGIRPCGLSEAVDFLGFEKDEQFEDIGDLLVKNALDEFFKGVKIFDECQENQQVGLV